MDSAQNYDPHSPSTCYYHPAHFGNSGGEHYSTLAAHSAATSHGHGQFHQQHQAAASVNHHQHWKHSVPIPPSWNTDGSSNGAVGPSNGHEQVGYAEQGASINEAVPVFFPTETKDHFAPHYADEKQYVSRATAEMLLSLKQINFADDPRQCYNYTQHAPYEQRPEIDYGHHHYPPHPPHPHHQPVSVNFQMTMSCISGVTNVAHPYGRHPSAPPAIPFLPKTPQNDNLRRKLPNTLPMLVSRQSCEFNSVIGEKVNICGICRKSYARPSTLKTHMRVHSGLWSSCTSSERKNEEKGWFTYGECQNTGEKPYTCNLCPKTFTQAANLTAHARTHSGEKPFRCPVCERRFSQSSSVTTHMRTHSGERPYRCRTCKKAFSDSSTLTKHVRIHSGEKPYQCQLCLLRFSQSGNLNRHMKVHMADRPT